MSKEKTMVGGSLSDDDTDPHGNDETRGHKGEVERSNYEDLSPDDDTELHRNDQTKRNAMEDKSDHEESPKTDKSQGNYSLSSLTEKEKEQILQLSKQETLEEGIAYALKHMTKRCNEAGEEVTPLTPLEKIVIRCYNAYSTPASKSSSSNQDNSPEKCPSMDITNYANIAILA